MPVGHGPHGPQRRPTVAHRRDYGIDSANVEIGVVLAGERQIRQVFGVGRRSYRHRRLALAEGRVGRTDFSLQFIGRIGFGK